ncbi:MAG: NUDIX domain-containing protein, partial [Chloroflexota bacterium]
SVHHGVHFQMRVRAVALLIQNDSVAVMERHRDGRHYFIFPGGGVEEGESVEQAAAREVEEELGVQARVTRQVAEVWFNGNRQLYFLAEQTGGEFGAGTGPEFTEPFDPIHGTYHPRWMPIADLLSNPVVPVEVAELIARYRKEGWPEGVITIHETPR